MSESSTLFPPEPRGLKGRKSELAVLEKAIKQSAPMRLALVGTGGSGKSMLAAALAHRLAKFFRGNIHWFRVGAWDYLTLSEMFALRFGLPRGDGRTKALQRFFRSSGPRLIVLDNHEDDRATARVLDTFSDAPVTFVITARRCLLGGVLVFPVTPPLVGLGKSAFPRVSALTRLLRFNPLALDIADGVVAAGAATCASLEADLRKKGVDRVKRIEHEDDLPEVALLIDWVWKRLKPESRRLLAVLAHVEGDHVDRASLFVLGRVKQEQAAALAPLLAFHLIQEPAPGRFTLHAVVRHAVKPRARISHDAVFEYYISLLERDAERLFLEQTHLFAAMDHASRNNDMRAMLRVEDLVRRLDGAD
jgi:hypothetical protein